MEILKMKGCVMDPRKPPKLPPKVSAVGITALIKLIVECELPHDNMLKNMKINQLGKLVLKFNESMMQSLIKTGGLKNTGADMIVPLTIAIVALPGKDLLGKLKDKLETIIETIYESHQGGNQEALYLTNLLTAATYSPTGNHKNAKIQAEEAVIQAMLKDVTNDVDDFMIKSQPAITDIYDFEKNAETLRWLKQSIDQLQAEYAATSKGKSNKDVVNDLSAAINMIYAQPELSVIEKNRKIIGLIWTQYNEKRDPADIYKNAGIFGGTKSAKSLEAHLNSDPEGHHSTRKLGLILQGCEKSVTDKICFDKNGKPDSRFKDLNNPYPQFPPKRTPEVVSRLGA